MCGESFSQTSKQPAPAKPHPLARPGRWSSIFVDGGNNDERSFFDDDGFATEEQALRARHRAVGGAAAVDHVIIPPVPVAGDHNPALLSREQLERLARAVLNNDHAGFDALRPALAAASLPQPKRSRADVADAIVAWLTDDSGHAGNFGGFINLDDEPGDYEHALGGVESSYATIHALVAEYVSAPASLDTDAARAVVTFLCGKNCGPGDPGPGNNNCIHADDADDIEYSFDADDSAELRRLVLRAVG